MLTGDFFCQYVRLWFRSIKAISEWKYEENRLIPSAALQFRRVGELAQTSIQVVAGELGWVWLQKINRFGRQ